MASFLRPPHRSTGVPSSSSSARNNSPPTAYRHDTLASTTMRRPRDTNLSVAAEREKLANRTSRVDLDFEEALASTNTFKLQEGRDFSSMGKELDSPTATIEGLDGQPSTVPTAGDSSKQTITARKLQKARHSTSPTRRGHPNPTGPNGGLTLRTSVSSSRPSLSEYSDVTSSPAPSNRDLPGEGVAETSYTPTSPPPPSQRTFGDAKTGETKRRNLFRSGGTVSTPDLTVGKKKKGPIPKVPMLPTGDYDDAHYPSTDVTPGPMSGWTATLSGRNRSTTRVDSKGSKTLKAKTGTFLAKVFSGSGGTVREKSKSGESSTPTTPHRTHFAHAFDSPPVPNIPQEYKTGPSNVADIFAPSSGRPIARPARRQSKPLPPISNLSNSDSGHHHHDMLVSPIETSTAGSTSSHSASPHVNRSPSPTAQQAQSPTKRPADVIGRIQANSSADGGRRRRSMSVGDADQWQKTLGSTLTPSKAKVTTPAVSPLDLEQNSYGSRVKSPATSIPVSHSKETSVTKEWENALKGWDSQIALLEIKDPSSLSPIVGVRPRSRTQDPIPIPSTVGLGRTASTSGGSFRTASVGSPPQGFSLSSSGSLKESETPSVYGTPPSGSTPTTPQFTLSESPTTPKRPTSGGRINTPSAPYVGGIVIGSTPASIGHTITTVKIQRSPSISAVSSPKLTESSGLSSPGTPASRSSSSNRPNSPPLQPSTSPRSATSPRVSSLRNAARPSLTSLGTPSTTNASNTGNLRPPGRTESMPSGTPPGVGSPKISLSLTSPSQENVRSDGLSARSSESKRRSYNSKNPASASEPSLIPPSTYGGVDDSVKTIRLITSGSKLGGGNRRGDVGEAGEMMPVTRLSSPTSSVRHTMSNVSTGTSAGRSSVSRDGSAAALSLTNVNGMSAEEIEARGEALASRIWEEDETFKPREKYTEWLGQTDTLNVIARRHYMDHFDFTNLRVDTAFRKLCGKLYVRGESQVLDRILIEFSRRYWEHNPNCILGNASNVHQVVYSLLILNTDLHIADLPQHMTKQQFVTNTMGTLVAPSRTSSTVATPARSSSPMPIHPYDSEHPRKTSAEASNPSLAERSTQNPTLRMNRSGSVTSGKGSLSREQTREASLSAHSSHRQLSGGFVQQSSSGGVTGSSSMNGSTVSVQDINRKHASAQGSVTSLPIVNNKAWEAEVESQLKDIYSAIRSSQILQPTPNGGLSPGARLGRGGSIRLPGGMNKFKRTSVMQSLVAQGTNGSNGSFDGRISPSPSSNTSLTDGYASAQNLFVPQTLGFASNLTHTIIREAAQEDDSRSINSTASNLSDVSITDEELALLGAPWAKEGMLTRKPYMESTGKRAKHRNWMDVFVVIQKGQLNMFIFGGANSSSRAASRPAGQRGAVGGGNWLDNATNVGEYMLSHSLSHPLPQGHDNRPYCFVLTLSTGMTFFFQAGTEELVNEWVSTCNYWAARQSKEPLAGGVSNMEYGWNRVEHDTRSSSQDDLDQSRPSIRDNTDNFSLMSGRSRMGRFGDGFSSLRSNPMADRIYINDWRAPGHSIVASTHEEETQLEALQRYAEKLKSDLEKHNHLREPMIALYTPKSSNLAKAMINWESKSQYLLAEIVKYEKYVESLKAAMKERLRRQGEKALERALRSSSTPALNPSRSATDLPRDGSTESQEGEGDVVTPGPHQVKFNK